LISVLISTLRRFPDARPIACIYENLSAPAADALRKLIS